MNQDLARLLERIEDELRALASPTHKCTHKIPTFCRLCRLARLADEVADARYRDAA